MLNIGMDTKPIVILVACLLLFCNTNRVHAANADSSVCRVSNLLVTTETDPRGRPQFFVSVVNTCRCTQKNVKLAFPGFMSAIEVIPASAIRAPDRDGGLCTLIGGRPVEYARPVDFIYESSTNFSFLPVSSTIVC